MDVFPSGSSLSAVHALTVVHEHEQVQHARRVGQEMPGAVRVHGAVRHDVGGSRAARVVARRLRRIPAAEANAF